MSKKVSPHIPNPWTTPIETLNKLRKQSSKK